MGRTPQGCMAQVLGGLKRPVFRLDKALYGHPNAGGFWEEHCDAKCQDCGFTPIENWPPVTTMKSYNNSLLYT